MQVDLGVEEVVGMELDVGIADGDRGVAMTVECKRQMAIGVGVAHVVTRS